LDINSRQSGQVRVSTKSCLAFLFNLGNEKKNGSIDGLVNGGDLVFTMLWTYTSSKSGLSARKSELNSGDATISLRIVNKDTS
jgi:hypothetical protein